MGANSTQSPPEKLFRWGLLVVDAVRGLRGSNSTLSFVDWEVIPHFDGRPDGIFVWFICDTRAAKTQFATDSLVSASDAVRGLAIQAGLPAPAAATLRSDVTSLEDIEAGGGRFLFFR